MVSLRNIRRRLIRDRYEYMLGATIVTVTLVAGFRDHRMDHVPFFPSVALSTLGLCECICDYYCPKDDSSGSSGSSGSYGSSEYLNKAPVAFERNVGQSDGHYTFVAHEGGHSIELSPQEARFDFPGSKHVDGKQIRAVIDGAASQVNARAEEPLGGRVNYFKGNDPKHWVTDIPTFGRITFPDVYPGISVTYHGTGGFVENDFIVNPGFDPSRIRIRFIGADHTEFESNGSLTISAGRHKLTWRKPVVYQSTATGRRVPVESRFRQDSDGAIGFEVGVYNVNNPLIIDPILTYSTYFGTPATEGAVRVASDASGNAYIIGSTNSTTFPLTPTGVFNVSVDGGSSGDVMLAKLSADGKNMIFTTHIGGGESNFGVGIALDASGNIYITGFTESSDFPHTSDLTTHSILTQANCYVTKLNPAANAIVYSTLIGGSSHDECNAIGVDAAGNAYVAGATMSTDLPLVNPVQTVLKSSPFNLINVDAFAVKVSPDGTKLLYSTYLGGTNTDLISAAAVDAAGNAYFTGYTTSTDFPISSTSVFQPTFGGAGGQYDSTYSTGDAFVVKMNPSGLIVYSTYLGGTQDDLGLSISIDGSGNAYVGGATLSMNFPMKNAFQSTYAGAGGETNQINGETYNGGDGFVSELNPSGTALIFSSYLGGTLDDRITGVAVDGSGNIWVAGHTLSQNFPITSDAPQKTNAGDDGGGQMAPQVGDAFVAEIGTSRTISFSTFLGGTSADWAGGIALDGQGGVIIAGGTSSTNFPTTTSAYQTKFGGITLAVPVGDAIIARYGNQTGPVPTLAGVSNTASYAGGSIAPGEAILIAGTLIGPSAIQGAALDSTGKVSSLVAGTQFLFDGLPAPIVFVSSTYSSVIVPYEVSGKTSTQLVAIYNGVQSAPLTIPVTQAKPGIFSSDASGSGTAAIINADGTRNSPQNPAARGSSIAFFMTGEGQTTPAGIDGSVTAGLIKPVLPVVVGIGGLTASNFQYLGEAPGEVAGVLQINVTIPPSSPTGDVPLVVSVGTANTQSGITVSVK